MKAITSLNLDVGVVKALKTRATIEGRSTSAIANEALGAFLRVAAPQPAGLVLSTRARLVLEAIAALTRDDADLSVEHPAWMFLRYRMDQVCRKLGTFPSTTLQYLRECERAEVLKCVKLVPLGMDAECPTMEHWYLPVP